VKNLQTSYKGIIAKHPDSDGVLQQVYKVLGDLVSLAGCTPTNVGESEQWVHTVNAAITDKISLSKILKGKSLYSALYGAYTVALTISELKAILQGSAKKNSPQQATATPQLHCHKWKQLTMGSVSSDEEKETIPQKTKHKEEARNQPLTLNTKKLQRISLLHCEQRWTQRRKKTTNPLRNNSALQWQAGHH
jgi:hypothetical protein